MGSSIDEREPRKLSSACDRASSLDFAQLAHWHRASEVVTIKLGQWDLVEELQRTAHSVVWLATNEQTEVAVKVLRVHQVEHEAYRRFADEVGLLARLGDFAGVLPLLDSAVPDAPTKDAPAWLAMPLATTIPDRLGEQASLEQVVEAIAACAATLARLADQGIHHRDIKPNNLFWREGEWLVGDFGIATWPEKQALTESRGKLGPAHFIAPEMIADPANAAAGPADAYSLAKTLWALALGDRYPPPGVLRRDQEATSLRKRLSHPRAFALEPILEYATQFEPEARPEMDVIARELSAWLDPPARTGVGFPTLDEIADVVNAITAPAEKAAEERESRDKQMTDLFLRLRDNGLYSLHAPFSRLGRVDVRDEGGFLLFGLHAGSGRKDAISIMSSSLSVIPHSNHSVSVSAEIAYEQFDDGSLQLTAGYYYPLPRQGLLERIWVESLSAVLGTQLAERAVDTLIAGLANNLTVAASKYSELLQQAEAERQSQRQPEFRSEGDNYTFATEPERPGGLVIYRKSDGSRDGYAIAWVGTPLLMIRADGDRLYVRTARSEGWITKSHKGSWTLSQSTDFWTEEDGEQA